MAVADGERRILHGGDDVRQEAFRVHRWHVAPIFFRAEEAARIALAFRGAAERIQLATAHRQGRIHPQVVILGVAVAQALRDAWRIDARRVQAGAVGLVALARFDRQVQVAAVAAQREAAAGAGRVGVAIAFIGRAGAGADDAVAHALLEDDVDDARDRVRPVLGGGAVAQHFDRLDRRQRDRVDVGAGRAAADRLLHIDQRLLVAALAVDQHEQLVGAQAAQRGRADDVGAVADEGRREVERWVEVLQHLAQFERTGRLDVFRADQAHGHGGIERRLGLGARAEHHDLRHIAVGFLCAGWCERRQQGRRQQGASWQCLFHHPLSPFHRFLCRPVIRALFNLSNGVGVPTTEHVK